MKYCRIIIKHFYNETLSYHYKKKISHDSQESGCFKPDSFKTELTRHEILYDSKYYFRELC